MGIAIGEKTGTTRNTVVNHEAAVEQSGLSRYNPREHASNLPGDLSSGRGLAGQVLSGVEQVTDSSRFVIQGISMDGLGAARLGLLTRLGPNQFILPEHGEVNEPEQEVDDTPAIPAFSADATLAIAELAELAGGEAQVNSLVAPVLSHLASGEDGFDKAVKSLGRAGVEAPRAAEIIAGFAEDLRDQTSAHLTAYYGVDGAAAVEWLDTLKAQERVSMGHRIFLGDPSVYSEIAKRFTYASTIKQIQSQEGWKK